jgi:hypothetical protein
VDPVTAEPIAAVVADIRANRTHHPAATDEAGIIYSLQSLRRAQQPQPVVDCTAVFAATMAKDSVNTYDDYPEITPPWDDALLCYVNSFNNVLALQVHREPWDGHFPTRTEWNTGNEVDWAKVRWVATTSVWIGGRDGAGRYVQTSGPCHIIRHAIDEQGAPADINWIALMAPRGREGQLNEVLQDDPNILVWEAAMVTLTAALNFLNASNVDVAEPGRPRPVRRRLARTGVTVQTIVVRPPGKRRAMAGRARPIAASESELSPVRGHWARYGPQFDRGLLFAGKFWIAGHVRGAGEADPRDYVLKPGRTA